MAAIAASPKQREAAAAEETSASKTLNSKTDAAKAAPEIAANWAKTKDLLFGNVTNQADWDAARQKVETAGGDLSDVPVTFSPQAAQRLAQASLSTKEKADLADKAAQLKNAQTNTALHAQSVAIEGKRLENEQQFTAPPGSLGLSGDAFLKTLPPAAASVKAISEGRMAPPNPSNRSAAAQNLLAAVNQYAFANLAGNAYASRREPGRSGAENSNTGRSERPKRDPQVQPGNREN
jgi:hypothetical protein